MDSDIILTPDEIYMLTNRKRKTAQAVVLRHMGIDFLTRPDGSIAVLREHVNKVMRGVIMPRTSKPQPDWSSLG